jgi:diguanylate cyclase (GGDEF)-like protein/PAS domain S-box-containing protein
VHRLLRQQLGKERASRAPSAAAWSDFLAQVDAAYAANEAERGELERAVETLSALLARHRKELAAQAQAGEQVRAGKATAARAAARARAESRLALLELDAGLRVRKINAAAGKLLGCERKQVRGEPVFALLEPLEGERLAAAWVQALSRGEPVAETLACTARDGRALAVQWVCLPLLRASGELARVRLLLRDETARVEAHEALREREEQSAAALAACGDVVLDWSLTKGTLRLPPSFARALGLAAAPGTGATTGKPADWFDRVHPEDLPGLRAALEALFKARTQAVSYEHRLRKADGSWVWYCARGTATRDAAGVAIRFCGLLTDVGQQHLLIERMAHDARHDALTGLPNRTLFLDLVRHSFDRTKRHKEYRFALLFIDIDRFKQVNDALGHAAGDDLLIQITRRLTGCLREGDRLARHAGDEFTMWLDDVHSAADALRVAARVHEAMAQPFDLGGSRVQSSASVGVALGSSRYEQAEHVLRDADLAMYRAKAQGSGRTVLFEDAAPERPQPAADPLEADLRRALQAQELHLLYQPIVDVASGRILGFEAFARWQHPRLGPVAPTTFLATAIEGGLMVGLDQWVLRTAGRQLKAWRKESPGAAGLTLSVNLSQQLFEQKDLAGQLGRLLREMELGPGDLNLDISESTLGAGAAITGSFAELRGRGVGLHVDGFGGRSWLGNLQLAELDSVKLDRSFFASGKTERLALRGVVAMAKDLGKHVIAAGVETAEQLGWVRDAGCDQAQGYYFSTPVDGTKVSALLRSFPRA